MLGTVTWLLCVAPAVLHYRRGWRSRAPIPVLAIAGSLAAKKHIPAGAGSFPTTGGLWIGLLVGIILILGGLTFLPSLALGPIADHLAMINGQLS